MFYVITLLFNVFTFMDVKGSPIPYSQIGVIQAESVTINVPYGKTDNIVLAINVPYDKVRGGATGICVNQIAGYVLYAF